MNNRFENTESVLSWLESKRKTSCLSVKTIPFEMLDRWSFDERTHNLLHESGKYFSIGGLRVSTNFGSIKKWDQPIIYQPEVGILGILTRQFQGVQYFLMQAKAEPGNPNIVQLAPTVQATESNYTQVHKGRAPLYLEYFLHHSNSKILVDQLQTGQGARFFKKKNRNMIVEVKQEIKTHELFFWLTLWQIKQLLTVDNVVNVEARSVLACMPIKESPYFSFNTEGKVKALSKIHFNSQNDLSKSVSRVGIIDKATDSRVIEWIKMMKKSYTLDTSRIPLKKISQWKRTDFKIAHESKQFFSIIAVSVNVDSREISYWTQPLLTSDSHGMAGFIVKKIKSNFHFLVQAKVEVGNFDVIELAPTVQCSDGEGLTQEKGETPFLDFFKNAEPDQVKYSTVQSEEGGRFFGLQNRYMIIEIDEAKLNQIPQNYRWIPLDQMMDLVKSGYFNIYARSLLAYAVIG
ncbi:MAG: NDP-hexose 2,3-dehydratase family protein [Deltaproteobacteria bacterium]|nr:NDP-hexose 2,3-dehydratase family protein [Deltaproteobacteria bacterium]